MEGDGDGRWAAGRAAGVAGLRLGLLWTFDIWLARISLSCLSSFDIYWFFFLIFAFYFYYYYYFYFY